MSKDDDALRAEVERRMRNYGYGYGKETLAVHNAVTVAVEMVLQERKRAAFIAIRTGTLQHGRGLHERGKLCDRIGEEIRKQPQEPTDER